ncbi:hypothetical protein RvY_14123 [Ramazzottius varieornatus]|uniref:Uncharacterized protein n=1 Tax=Ramazzottius varieornatus TaxID=947166 RepID=A0A1D1VVC9_RAMVA|nr:hypothetical protein RvY_14123 [Ramazzottius varieornatus]
MIVDWTAKSFSPIAHPDLGAKALGIVFGGGGGGNAGNESVLGSMPAVMVEARSVRRMY